jgi:DNA-binding transcriptional regulator GbsR (MarR family)
MTRCYAACMLLDHGPLTERELVEITGWSLSVVDTVLRKLRNRGWVRHFSERGTNRYFYELA